MYKRSGLSVTADGKELSESDIDYSYSKKSGKYRKKNRFENVYAKYYHGDFGLLELTNENAESDDSLLIIGDSFSNCMERFFAENYKHVYVIDPRHYTGDISAFIDEHDITDGVFLLSRNNLGNSAFGLGDTEQQ